MTTNDNTEALPPLPEPYEAVEQEIVNRYRVEKRSGGGFWPYCVKAGDGTRELFIGHKTKCEEVAQALRTACLDGAFMASRAALAQRQQVPEGWSDADADAARLALELECMLTDKDVPTSTVSRWWDSAHEALDLHRKRVTALTAAPSAQAEPSDDWQHLKQYGYAPGGYMSKCHRCGATPIMDKLAVTCRPCAETMHNEAKGL